MGRESATGAADPGVRLRPRTSTSTTRPSSPTPGRYVLTTDERGGGILPPGASCSPTNDIADRQRRPPRLPRGQAAQAAPDQRQRRVHLLREELQGRQGDLPGADPHQAPGGALHRARVPADPGPEPDLHGLVRAGHAGRRLRGERQRHARLQGRRLHDPGEREPVGLAHLQGASATPTAASPTTAPRPTSTSATAAAAPSRSTRSRCRRRPRRAAARTGLGEGFSPSTLPRPQGAHRPQDHRAPAPGPDARRAPRAAPGRSATSAGARASTATA